VLLHAPIGELDRRLGSWHRPLLDATTPDARRERLESLGRERARWYQRAELSLDSSSQAPDELAQELAARLRALEQE
jgi:shikimate kinase